jgi:hypothetical protein
MDRCSQRSRCYNPLANYCYQPSQVALLDDEDPDLQSKIETLKDRYEKKEISLADYRRLFGILIESGGTRPYQTTGPGTKVIRTRTSPEVHRIPHTSYEYGTPRLVLSGYTDLSKTMSTQPRHFSPI